MNRAKRIVFVPRWKNEVVLQRLGEKGNLNSDRLRRLGILAVNLPVLAEYLADHEEVEKIYIAYHPRNDEERDRLRPDQALDGIAVSHVNKLERALKKLWSRFGSDSSRGQTIERLINRLQNNRGKNQTIQVIAKCMRQDPPEKPGPGSYIFKALGELAIAEFKKAHDNIIQQHVHKVKELFRLDLYELLVLWHRVMAILSALDLDLLALERLLHDGNGANENKSAEYLKLMLHGAPKGFSELANDVYETTTELNMKLSGPMDESALTVISDFLQRLGQLKPGCEAEPGLARKLVKEAKGKGHFHDCVWALSQHLSRQLANLGR